jgi:hypothetical protein
MLTVISTCCLHTANEQQLVRDLAICLPDAAAQFEASDTIVLSFRTSDAEIEAIIAALKRLDEVLEVDRA